MTDSVQTIREGVRAAFAKWSAAWNNGDLEGYLAGYLASDKTRWISGGQVLEGAANILRMYRAGFDTPEKMGKLVLERLDVEPMGDQDALVFGEIQHEAFGQVNNAIFTVHVRHVDGAWRILSDHTSPKA